MFTKNNVSKCILAMQMCILAFFFRHQKTVDLNSDWMAFRLLIKCSLFFRDFLALLTLIYYTSGSVIYLLFIGWRWHIMRWWSSWWCFFALHHCQWCLWQWHRTHCICVHFEWFCVDSSALNLFFFCCCFVFVCFRFYCSSLDAS